MRLWALRSGRGGNFPHALRLILLPLLLCGAALGGLGLGLTDNRVGANPIEAAELAISTPVGTGHASAAASIKNCAACHKTDALFSHPVKVAPSMAVPTDWPLEGGNISCVTCHDSNPTRHANAHNQRDALLRSTLKGGAFCAQCHQPGDVSQHNRHAGMPIRSHLRWPGKPEVQTALHGRMDAETRTCLSCHDDALAADPTMQAAGAINMTESHPVGVRYGGTSLLSRTTSEMPLQAEALLDRRIRLFDHQVGCNSCHSPYSTQPALLVMSNTRSQLCLSCHMDR